ncbi:MAG: hypothetical protein JNK45_15585 [Myxococcales bacterium]|nr:hypothetical protein [Myxococcales bacterium]
MLGSVDTVDVDPPPASLEDAPLLEPLSLLVCVSLLHPPLVESPLVDVLPLVESLPVVGSVVLALVSCVCDVSLLAELVPAPLDVLVSAVVDALVIVVAPAVVLPDPSVPEASTGESAHAPRTTPHGIHHPRFSTRITIAF